MPFCILANESVEVAIKRIANEELNNIVHELQDDDLEYDEKIHQLRKRCKRLRGLIRLVRPQLRSRFQVENKFYRDLAKEFTSIRDSQALLESLDRLLEYFSEQFSYQPIYDLLNKHKARLLKNDLTLNERLNVVTEKVYIARTRIYSWKIKRDGFTAIKNGLKKTYTDGRNAMFEAYSCLNTTSFHEWRKHVKYHMFHLLLINRIKKKSIMKRYHDLYILSEYLGEYHDLANLSNFIHNNTENFHDQDMIDSITELIERRHSELREIAKPISAKLYAKKPKKLITELEKYWNSWE